MSRSSLVLLVALSSIHCIDYGVRLPAPTSDAPPVDTGAGDSSGCVEGMTTPAATGPQLAFSTLAVDQPNLAIAVGDVVTWTNNDSMVHTVTAGAPGAPLPTAQGGFDSGDIAPGAKWAYRFCRARTVIYFCKTHASQMNNYRVAVKP
jgi:plastocyanin